MPQPLRKRIPLDYTISKIAEKPSLCAALTQVVAMSSLLETRLSGLLTMLSGGSAEVTLAMFMAVNSTDAQRAMLRSAGEVALKGRELEAFLELLEEYKPRARERNRLVHGVWATSTEVPDALMLLRALDLAEANKALALIASQALQPGVQDIEETVWRNCMIYRERDFIEVYSRLADYDRQIIEFWQNLMQARIDAHTNPDQATLPLEDPGQDPRPQEG